MAYFDEFPDILLPSFVDGRTSSSDLVRSKNLFKRAKIRDDFFSIATVFDLYTIDGDDRPDNVAKKLYGDSNLDWVVLLSNNIINVRDEWPMNQYDLERHLDNKYSQDHLSRIHHYETKKVITSYGLLLLEEGSVVDENYTFKYYDIQEDVHVTVSGSELMTSVSMYQHEVRKNEKKRNIYTLRENFLETVFADMREIMTYTNSSQYIDRRTKQGDNLRILSTR